MRPSGLSSLIGKDSVITFKISSTSAVEGVEGVSSSISVIFGFKAAAFLFFGAATFGSGLDFLFFCSFFIFFHHPSSLSAQNTNNPLSLLPLGTLVQSLIVRVFKVQGIHHPIQPSLWSGAEGRSHQLILFFGIISQHFITHCFNHF
jgi:hypothetical protein